MSKPREYWLLESTKDPFLNIYPGGDKPPFDVVPSHKWLLVREVTSEPQSPATFPEAEYRVWEDQQYKKGNRTHLPEQAARWMWEYMRGQESKL